MHGKRSKWLGMQSEVIESDQVHRTGNTAGSHPSLCPDDRYHSTITTISTWSLLVFCFALRQNNLRIIDALRQTTLLLQMLLRAKMYLQSYSIQTIYAGLFGSFPIPNHITAGTQGCEGNFIAFWVKDVKVGMWGVKVRNARAIYVTPKSPRTRF